MLEDRRRLMAAVDTAMSLLVSGLTAQAAEVEGVDFKEEAGRRGRGGVILPGIPRNTAVGDQLADEVACLANTPGGGALIVGIADDGTVVGAATERDWLRQRINELVDVAPAVEERTGPGAARLLVLLVAEAREPVENRGGVLRWRVGTACRPVDRSEWWAQRLRRSGTDPLAAATSRTVADITTAALTATRRLIGSGGDLGFDLAEQNARELYTRLGVLLPDGHLTAAGVHMFCAAPRAVLDLTSLDVAGGDVVSRSPDMSGRCLVEQLLDIEGRLDVLDKQVASRAGLVVAPARQIPWPAVREALLNAVVHRDWLPADPVHLTWVEADASLDVVSPGGFAGGVTSESVLSARYARNPTLADLARAMGLVERSGVGVDRMYREMISVGHRPPLIEQEPGPRVRCRLVGGRPVQAVETVVRSVEPAVRRRDVRTVLTLYALLRDGFVTAGTLSTLLQVGAEEAEEVFDVITSCGIGAGPAVLPGSRGSYLPGKDLVKLATGDPDALAAAGRRGLLTWWRPDATGAEVLVGRYLSATGRISSGDLADLTGITPTAALKMLGRLEADDVVRRGGTVTRGRNAHFVAGETLTRGHKTPG